MSYRTSAVFGISTDIRSATYVDRSNLDSKIGRLLRRDTHIALKGASKSGKSWLRKKCVEESIVVQCRFNMSIDDLYRAIANELGINFETSAKSSMMYEGGMEANSEFKVPVIAKAQVEIVGSISHTNEVAKEPNRTVNNLKFIADKINESGKRLIIEDFHYLPVNSRQAFSFDLKTLWDYGCFVIIVGVWTETNLLPYMNPDLAGRVEELSLSWTAEELKSVIHKGCIALNIQIDDCIIDQLVQDSFGNVGILQTLLLRLVEDIENIEETCKQMQRIWKNESYIAAARSYASQLDAIYQQFAKRVSAGIRRRNKSTGIYAYTMKAIVAASDQELISGYRRTDIYDVIHAEENRIQKGNLQTILRKLEEIQDSGKQGSLVIAYDESIDAVFVVDLQLLFYRKHHTTNWPWESMVEEAKQFSLFDVDSIE